VDERTNLQQHELEAMRRSLAMSETLPRVEIERVLEACGQLMAERVRIERILAELGPAWGGARRALNELHKVLRPSR